MEKILIAAASAVAAGTTGYILGHRKGENRQLDNVVKVTKMWGTFADWAAENVVVMDPEEFAKKIGEQFRFIAVAIEEEIA